MPAVLFQAGDFLEIGTGIDHAVIGDHGDAYVAIAGGARFRQERLCGGLGSFLEVVDAAPGVH